MLSTARRRQQRQQLLMGPRGSFSSLSSSETSASPVPSAAVTEFQFQVRALRTKVVRFSEPESDTISEESGQVTDEDDEDDYGRRGRYSFYRRGRRPTWGGWAE